MVHSDHASILHRYADMVPKILDARTWTQKERRKKGKRKKKGREKESGKEKGREMEKKEWKVKERGRGMESEREGRWGKGRWKEDSLRNVGCTDTQVVLYSVPCYA